MLSVVNHGRLAEIRLPKASCCFFRTMSSGDGVAKSNGLIVGVSELQHCRRSPATADVWQKYEKRAHNADFCFRRSALFSGLGTADSVRPNGVGFAVLHLLWAVGLTCSLSNSKEQSFQLPLRSSELLLQFFSSFPSCLLMHAATVPQSSLLWTDSDLLTYFAQAGGMLLTSSVKLFGKALLSPSSGSVHSVHDVLLK